MSRNVWMAGTRPIPALISPGASPWTSPIVPSPVPFGSTATVMAGPASAESCGFAAAAGTHARSDASDARMTGMADLDRTYAKFTFFKLDPEWQRRDPEARAQDKREFLAACDDFAQDRSLRAYSTVGTRGDTDLLLLSQSPVLEDIHTFHVVLGQSGLARWASTPYSYEKKREWYGLPMEERQRIMANHIEVGRRHPEISINTAYSFGLDDQEFVVSFEGDDPGEFLDLVQELRGTESSSYTLRDMPIFTCVAMSLGRALDALDGTATTAVTPATA